ncbi:MAG: spore germination protein [Bacilli bacterium]|nr:spore germination protein [Bacilli bacterium]MDD4282174.1 spore germination protein [Bacilli bacterium]MDD4718547.1 spore germination protein [Bacilli bacterium]
MFGFNKKKNKVEIDSRISGLNRSLSDYKLSNKIEENIKMMKEIFKDNDNLKIRKVINSSNPKFFCYIAFFNGMVDSKIINDSIIKPFTISNLTDKDNNITKISNQVIYINELKESEDLGKMVEGIASGDTLMFLDNEKKVLILNTKGFEHRAISEPESEKILVGPREGFTESLIVNTVMIQRKIRTNQLKIKYMGIGRTTNTHVAVCYIESVVNRDVLNELLTRLEGIDIDAILDNNYIAELIGGKGYSPFKRMRSTERPDAVVGKLLEGRVAVLIDGSPVVVTVPHLFIENFQSPEDYYVNADYASISRIIRIIGYFITICTPSLYIAIEAFHHEMIPTPLFINIAMERQSAPLPAGLEMFVMLFVFELLKETGIRMPGNIGDALSIVGALVIGQAAVEAELVAASMIIVIGITGIAGLLTPKLDSSVLLYRFLILFFTILIGFLGFIIGLSILVINILNQESFGVLQVERIDSIKPQDIKDKFIRRGWKNMINRPGYLTNNEIRKKENG